MKQASRTYPGSWQLALCHPKRAWAMDVGEIVPEKLNHEILTEKNTFQD